MPDEMRSVNRKVSGPEPAETRASLIGSGTQTAGSMAGQLRRLPGAFRRGRAVLIDTTVEEQFSEAWFIMALLLTLVGLIFHFDGLLLIAALLLTVIVVSWLWNRISVLGLRYQRHLSVRRAFVGETVRITLAVANHKFLSLSWVRITDIFPPDLPLGDAEVTKQRDTNLGELSTFWAMKWYERAQRDYELHAIKRGYYRFGPAKLETGDLFGLFRSLRTLPDETTFIVYPKIVPIAELGLPAKEPFGDVRAPRFLFDDPIRTVGIRDYHPEDDFRRVHWKATARRQELQTRVLEPASSHNLVVFLNVATLELHWQGTYADVLEQAISAAASLCYYGIEQRWPTGVIANGALPRSDQPIKVLPGRSPDQITAILEALAAVTPFATAPIERLIAAESPRLPWGSTLVIVSAIITDALAATLLELRRMGRRVALVSLDDKPTPDTLRDVLVYRVPQGEMPHLVLSQPSSGEQSLLTSAQRQQQAIAQAGRTLHPAIRHPSPE